MSCTCAPTGGNTGTPSCFEGMDVAAQYYIVNKYNSNGERFSIDQGQVFDQAFWDGLIKAVNPLDRIYPIPANLKNVTDERADPTVESFNDGSSDILTEGIRAVDALGKGTIPPKLVGILKGFKCKEIAVYVRDKSNNLQGELNADCTKLYPLDIAQGSWNPEFIKKTDSTSQKVRIRFEYSQNLLDENLGMILSSTIDADIANTKGMQDVVATELAPAPTTTAAKVQLSTIYGNASTGKPPYTGATAVIELVNATQGDTVITAVVTESATSEYEFDFAGDPQTIGDEYYVKTTDTTGVYDVSYEVGKKLLTPAV